MKSIIKKMLKYIRRNKLYYTIFFCFALLGTLLVFLLTTLSFSLVGKKYEAELRKSEEHILNQVMYYVDQSLYGTTTNLIDEYILNNYFNEGFSNFFLKKNKQSGFEYLKYYKALLSLRINNPYIYTITLYSREPNCMIDSRYGISYIPEQRLDSLNQWIPLERYLILSQNNNKLYAAPASDFPDTSWYFTIIRAVPLYSSLKESNGIFAVSFDKDLLWRDIATQYNMKGNLMLLDESGKLLLDNFPDTEEGRKLRECAMEVDLTVDTTKNSSDFTFRGVHHNITWQDSSTSGWRYITVTPLDTLVADSNRANQIFFLSASLLVLLSLFVARFATSRVYEPVRGLRKRISHNTAFNDKDDISAIQDTLAFFEGEVDDMRKIIAQNKQLICYKAVSDILHNPDFNKREIQEKLSIGGISLHAPLYCIWVAEFESCIFFSLSLEQREYISAKFEDIAHNLLPGVVFQLTESQCPNRIIMLINLSIEDYDKLLVKGESFPATIYSQLRMHINLAYIAPLEGFDALQAIAPSFSSLSKVLEYSFLYGYGHVFDYEMLDAWNKNDFPFDIQEYHALEILLMSENLEDAKQKLQSILTKARQEEYSLRSIRGLLTQLFNLLYRVGQEKKVLNEAERNSLSQLDAALDFEEASHILYSMLENYESISSKNSDEQLAFRVMSYVKANCSQDISLSSIAETFLVSSSHLSRTFKNKTGTNLSVYIVNSKLEYAAEQLSTNPNCSVNSVAETLGYYTPAYFNRLFKAKYGTTPYQYQKRYQLELTVSVNTKEDTSE